jgi:hypothetical protein
MATKSHKFILDTFVSLTSMTYPFGFEDLLICKEYGFPDDIQKDEHGNFFYKIGNSRTMFTSHLDTVSKEMSMVTHKFEGNFIKSDGSTILGADDKAGVSILLYMIENKIPGIYYFFIGEEVGCVGSGLASKSIKNIKNDYDRCISFDRRDTGSVITSQSSTKCCSEAFASQLSKELSRNGLKYRPDNTGVYTDSAEFIKYIPECTNISVGYYNEHTFREMQDIEHLAILADVCLLVDWEKLPTKRDPSKVEYDYDYGYGGRFEGYGTKSYKGYNHGGNGYNRGFNSHNDWRKRDGDYGYGWGSILNEDETRFEPATKENLSKTYGYHDDFYEDDAQKKTRRGKRKRNGKKFIERGGDLIEVGTTDFSNNFTDEEFDRYYDGVKAKYDPNRSKYNWIKHKILDESTLAKDEIEILKKQYFNLNDVGDKIFSESLSKDVKDV